ncbi:hypothetical protein [Novosphingobium sp. AP12]|uniref:hypothetical protein n=1 Tax=Novosphingobium sp. AP12 TaxID=1144305 RepID=UPI0012FC23A0|nr:hypothetical protein [Novosphingobium sp. AP12]
MIDEAPFYGSPWGKYLIYERPRHRSQDYEERTMVDRLALGVATTCLVALIA